MSEPINPKLSAFAQQLRRDYRAMIPAAGKPDAVGSIENFSIELTSGYSMPARLYQPSGKHQQPLPILLFIHGGGWVSGDLDTHDVLARALSNGVNAIVLAIEYRLAPEHPAPAGIEDCYSALQWLDDNATGLNGDKQRIVIVGDSAGGNLAGVISRLSRDRKGPQIQAQWLMYPAVNFDITTPSFEKYGDTNFPTKEVMNTVRQSYVPSTIPLLHPLIALDQGNLQGLPPTLISVGSVDPLSAGCISYSEALQNAGVTAKVSVFDQQQHGFIQFYKDQTNNPGGQPALDEGLQFLNRYL